MAMYFMFMLPGILLMVWAQSKVKGSYSKYSKVANSRGLTGAITTIRASACSAFRRGFTAFQALPP